MTAYSPRAARHVAALQQHYEEKERPEAIANLLVALQAAERHIDGGAEPGLPAPRPYPWLARPDQAWIKSGRYWVVYRTREPRVILGVFWDAADIPSRS